MSIRIFDTPGQLYEAAVATVSRLANEALAARGRFLLALSGGETPIPLFERLAQPPYSHELPWQQTHVFWADERLVPPDDEASNFGQAWAALLSRVAIPEGQIHAVNGALQPEQAIHDYANELALFGEPSRPWPRFDLVLLGLGADGHTASLFPGSAGQLPADAPLYAVQASYDNRPAGRITLTPAAINAAREVIFLVSGSNKAQALARALTPGASSAEVPARLIRPINGSLTWLVDRDAASMLDAGSAGAQHHPGDSSRGDHNG